MLECEVQRQKFRCDKSDATQPTTLCSALACQIVYSVERVSVIALHVVYNKRYIYTSNCSKEKDMLKFYGCKVGRSSESKVE